MKFKACTLLFFLCFSSAGCSPVSDATLVCSDLFPEEQSRFSVVASFMVVKCGGCHTSANPIYGYDFSGAQAVYTSTISKAETVYAQIATGMMPPPSLGNLEDEYIKSFRSWYCRGAHYDTQ